MAPLLRELIHSVLSRAKPREHSLSPLSGLLRRFIDIYIRRLTRNDRQRVLRARMLGHSSDFDDNKFARYS